MKTFHKILILALVSFAGLTAQAQNNDKSYFIEIGYSANNFKDVGSSGNYGVGLTALPWNIKPNLPAGIHVAVGSNYGLAEPGAVLAQVGPSVGYYITPSLKAIMPLDVMCSITVTEAQANTYWALGLSPALYVGKRKGLYVGPNLVIPFTGGGKVTVGFKGGFFF